MNTDSLMQILEKTQADSVTISNYLMTFAVLTPDDHDAKMEIIKWSISNAQKLKLKVVESKAYLYLGEYFRMTQKYSEATDSYNKSISIAKEINDHSLMARGYNLLGVMAYEFDQIDQAIFYYKKSIEESTKGNDLKRASTYYYNLSGMYFEKHDQSKDTGLMAIELAKYAMQLQYKFNDTISLVTTFNGLALMYIETDQLDSAFKYLNKADEFLPKINNDSKYMTHYFRYSSAYLKKKEFRKAIEYLDKGLKYVTLYDSKRLEYQYYRQYAIAYTELNNLKLANDYNEKYIYLHDSIISVENYQKSQQIYARYEFERKENEILKLSKDNEIKKLIINQEEKEQENLRRIIVAIVIIVILLITFSLILVRINRARKKINAALELKNEEIKAQSLILNNQSKMISRYQSQMNPHFVFNALNSIQGQILQAKQDDSLKQLNILSRLMRSTLENSEMEWISMEKEFEYLSLYISFEELKLGKKITFNLNCEEDDLLIPPMMIQPLIENSIKHGNLQSIENPRILISLEKESTALKISVDDNGTGTILPVEQLLKKSHALSILIKRIKILWEELGETAPDNLYSIKSKANEGFSISFYLPLKYQF